MNHRRLRQILDQNIISLVHHDQNVSVSLEELVIDIMDDSASMMKQVVPHRYCADMVYALFNIMNENTPRFPRVAGNAAFILGSLLEDENGRRKVQQLLLEEKHQDDTSYLLPSLTALIQTQDQEAMTNASGTLSLLLESAEGREWALNQPSMEWMVFILSECLLQDYRDLCVASNCALSLARVCMSPKGQELVLQHKDSEHILKRLMESCTIDREGRGMNAAFALAYLCESEEGTKTITDFKECIDLQLAMINMLRSVDDGCRKNAVFCLKNISNWKNGQDSLNQDLDIEQMLSALCNLLSCGDESLGRMAAVTLTNLASRREGYMLQKDRSKAKVVLQHVLSQMVISDAYRQDAFTAMKALMIPKPDAPTLKVLDAHCVSAEWEPVDAKSECQVFYELYCDDKVVYTGNECAFTTRHLKEKTEYEFRLRAFTEDDEESFVSESVTVQTFRAISSPPRNVRAVSVTANKVKIVWEKPNKICGNLKGYYIQEVQHNINYKPTDMFFIASNLEADKEYHFEVCAVTQRGRGEVADLHVRTLRQDFFAPSKPKIKMLSNREIVVSWKPPSAPAGRINGYELLQNGKSVYFGMKRYHICNVQPDSKYKFSVVVWTNEGRNESVPCQKKIPKRQLKETKKQQKFDKEEDFVNWIEADGDDADEGDEPVSSRSIENGDHGNKGDALEAGEPDDEPLEPESGNLENDEQQQKNDYFFASQGSRDHTHGDEVEEEEEEEEEE
eukprot:TCONS_00013674-protein